MNKKIMSKDNWLSFVDRLISDDRREVVGVQSKGEKFVFDPLDNAKDLKLDHDVTILPPKKYLLPTCEELMRFSLSDGFEMESCSKAVPRIIIGMHPYDLIAIQQMDQVYLGKNPDENYKNRRENTLIIASDILTVSDRSFAASMGTCTVSDGFDLLVTDLGDAVVVEEGSPAGTELLSKYTSAQDAGEGDVAKVTQLRQKKQVEYKVAVDVDKKEWAGLLEQNYEHTVWKERSEKCLECGSCTLVCPTCFCYDVEDTASIGLKDGVRTRTWDGCLLRDFTLIGSGEVFRESKEDRYRHRYYRKGKYLPERYGFVACVGCGRCATQCLPDIADPADIFNTLHGSNMRGEPKILAIPKVEEPDMAEPLLTPRPATIKRVEKMAAETFFEIELDDGQPLGHVPGQFVEVSVFGYGEAPISISSPPGGNTFELVVRTVGDVTSKLSTLKSGDKIGIRGPLGNGFDVEGLKGKNLLFIAGGLGIVPMRSLINHVLNKREDFGEVTILYGAKHPKEFLFEDEIFRWHERKDIVHKFTVDQCTGDVCWEGNIGVITTLIPKVQFDPKDTTAVVIGPPIMYKFVIRDLKGLGMPDENILMSLERRMKCGVGKCGHCQINGIYVCKEGPVFNYAEIKGYPEAL
ncbi:MAG: 4Fe-4S dicluster domain-containing protein [Thermoplasmata archaeon]|nr:4Fe-4S dicluster domain-containing protein [Thermoplasmata archaeon]